MSLFGAVWMKAGYAVVTLRAFCRCAVRCLLSSSLSCSLREKNRDPSYCSALQRFKRRIFVKHITPLWLARQVFQVQDLNTGRYCSTAGGSLYHICMIHTASLHYELKLIPFMIGPSTHPCDPHQTSSPIFSEHSGVIRLVLESWGCDAVDRSLGTFFVMNLHSDPMDRKWVLPKSLKYLCEVWLFFFFPSDWP